MALFPIAVIDTGVGGLSVVQAIRQALPYEDVHYFADTANLPYGLKSPELIHHLALKMAKSVQKLTSCKLLVIACHTISAWCIRDIEEALKIPVIGMVEPSLKGLKTLIETKELSSVAILSTKATLSSQVYRNAWSDIDKKQKVKLVEKACGILVNLVEEGDVPDLAQEFILNHFLSEDIKNCDALLIGCTHFSALIDSLQKVLKPSCHIIDAASLTAEATALALGKCNTNTFTQGKLFVFVNDNQERFLSSARRFIHEDFSVNLIKDHGAFLETI